MQEHLEGLGPLPRPVQGQHEVFAALLAQGVPGHQLGELAGERAVPAQLEHQSGAFLHQREPHLFQPGGLRLQPGAGGLVQRGAPPDAERLLELRARLFGPSVPGGVPPLLGPLHELLDVDPVLSLGQQVARGRGDQQIGHSGLLEGLAEGGHADGDLVAGRRGGRFRPDGVHQGVHRHDPVGVEQQHRQDRGLAPAVDAQRTVIGLDEQRSQHSEDKPIQKVPRP